MAPCLLTAAVLAISWLPVARYPSHPVRVLPTEIERAISPGNPIVLAYPYPIEGATGPMVWQVHDHFRFRLLGAYALVPDRSGRATEIPPLLSPPGVQELMVYAEGGWGYPYPPATTEVESEILQFIETNHVAVVLLDTRAVNEQRVASLFQQAMGPPTLSLQGFEMWKVT